MHFYQRAELGAFYTRAYSLTRDELRYILDPADVNGLDYFSEWKRTAPSRRWISKPDHLRNPESLSERNTMNDDWWLLVIIAIAATIFWNLHKNHQQYLAEKKVVDDEREKALARPAPPEIQRSIREFRAGTFEGEEASPLAYVGYRVGITKGLPVSDRHIRLDYCYYMELPEGLPAKYDSWGKPATWRRFERMHSHLTMLANQRRPLNNYRHAVEHWDLDRNWFKAEFEPTAQRYRKYGYRE